MEVEQLLLLIVTLDHQTPLFDECLESFVVIAEGKVRARLHIPGVVLDVVNRVDDLAFQLDRFISNPLPLALLQNFDLLLVFTVIVWRLDELFHLLLDHFVQTCL